MGSVSLKIAALCLLLTTTSGCTKFRRLDDSEKFTEVTFDGGKRNALLTSQDGGVMIWGVSPEGERFALALDDESDQKTVRLKNGLWNFFSTGWTGAGRFEGTVRCATSQETLAGSPVIVDLQLATGQCGSGLFGDSAYVSAGALLPLRITTCRSGPIANVTGGDDTDCAGVSNIGPFRAFKVQLNEYAPTSENSPTVTNYLRTGCKNNASWGGGSAGLDIPTVQIPVGAASGSPVDTTVFAYADPTCSTAPVEFRFAKGLAGGSAFTTLLYPGTGPLSASLYILGPAPSISSLSPNMGSWGGGTSISFSGSYFFTGSTVQLNGKTCAVTSTALSTIVCDSPNSLTTGSASIVVNNTLGQTTLGAATAFSYQENNFGNAVDADTLGGTVVINATTNWSNGGSLGGRTGSASRNVSNIASGADYSDLTLVPGFTATEFAVSDEVLWHVTAASSSTDCSSSGTLTAGKFGFGRVSSASSPTLQIKPAITSSPNNTNIAASSRNNGDTFCVLQVVRVPNFKNLTLDSSSGAMQITKDAFSFANGHGGIIPLRVAGDLTLTGSNTIWLYAKALGYPGGAGAAQPFQGGSRLGVGLSNATQLSNADTGGAPGQALGAGGGASYGDGGNGGAATPSGKGVGITSCVPSANCALFGGGGGGGNAAAANGGAGGGIIMLFAKNVVFSGFSSSFTFWNGGQEGLGSTTFSAGAGGGGTSYVVTQNAGTASLGIISAGGHAATGGPTTHGGGGGGGGVSLLRECFASKFSSFSADVAGGNNGAGSSFNGVMGSVGSSTDDQISSGADYCP